jgi:hypothetical protein
MTYVGKVGELVLHRTSCFLLHLFTTEQRLVCHWWYAYHSLINPDVDSYEVSRVAQSVLWLVTGWKTGRSRFDPRQRRKDFSSSLCVQTGSGAHPASCTMGTGGPFSGLKGGRGVTVTIHPHLMPRMSRSYTFSPPKRLRGV